MLLRKGGDADAVVAVALDQADEVLGVLQPLRVADPLAVRVARRAPAAASRPTRWRSSATEWFTAVRCAIGNSVVSVAIRSVIATVRSRVEPPAP